MWTKSNRALLYKILDITFFIDRGSFNLYDIEPTFFSTVYSLKCWCTSLANRHMV